MRFGARGAVKLACITRLQLENHFGVRAEMDDLEIDHFRSIAAIASFITTRHNADR